MPKTETSGDDAAEEWSTPVNGEEDPAIKAERRSFKFFVFKIVRNREYLFRVIYLSRFLVVH